MPGPSGPGLLPVLRPGQQGALRGRTAPNCAQRDPARKTKACPRPPLFLWLLPRAQKRNIKLQRDHKQTRVVRALRPLLRCHAAFLGLEVDKADEDRPPLDPRDPQAPVCLRRRVVKLDDHGYAGREP